MKIALKVIKDEIAAAEILLDNFPKDFLKVIELIETRKGRLIISGMGKSGYIGQKISASLSSTGTKSFYMHPAEASHGDLGMIDDDDIVMLLSNSGETKELFDIINFCKRFKIPIIGITMNVNSSLALSSDYLLNIPFVKEASNIDAPTSSSTMMLMLGDALMVTLYERKGFSKDNFKIFHPGGKLGAKMLKVENLMHNFNSAPKANKYSKMSEVIIEISTKGFGCCAILDDNNKKICGIITDGDLRRHMDDMIISMYAKDVMNPIPKVISKNLFAAEALNIMNEKKITSLLVSNNDVLEGIIHIHDLLRAGVQ